MKYYSLEKGLGGILFYVNTRIKSYERKIPFDVRFLEELKMKINTLSSVNQFVLENIKDFNGIMSGHVDYQTSVAFPDFLFGEILKQIGNISDCPLGIYKGLTGYLLKDLL